MAIVLLHYSYINTLQYNMEVITGFAMFSFASSLFMIAYVSVNNRKALKKIDKNRE